MPTSIWTIGVDCRAPQNDTSDYFFKKHIKGDKIKKNMYILNHTKKCHQDGIIKIVDRYSIHTQSFFPGVTRDECGMCVHTTHQFALLLGATRIDPGQVQDFSRVVEFGMSVNTDLLVSVNGHPGMLPGFCPQWYQDIGISMNAHRRRYPGILGQGMHSQ